MAALRPLDNTMEQERPKKMPKIALEEEEEAPDKPLDVVVEYVASEDLKALEDPNAKIESLLEELDSKDWIKACEALNDLRRFALHHSSFLLPILDKVTLALVKAMKNPRSALCKTSIMASTDIFTSLGHSLLPANADRPAFDQLLLQLLLKASQDKKFVCEEAGKALKQMSCSLLPIPLLGKLQAYVKHSNPRVRAKAGVAISNCVSATTDVEVVKEFGLAILLQLSARLLNDKFPDARQAARSIAMAVHAAFSKDDNKPKVGEEKSQSDDDESENDKKSLSELWKDFCSSNLPSISVQPITKITLQQ